MKAQDLEGLPVWDGFDHSDYIGFNQNEEDARRVRRWPLYKELLEQVSEKQEAAIRPSGVDVGLADSAQPVAV